MLTDAGDERRREDVGEHVRPVLVLLRQEFVGDFAQPLGQRVGDLRDVGARLLADDGAHRIDMLVDQRDRDAGHVGRVLDQPAQAVGGRRDEGIAEGRRFALDVVGGMEQRFAGRLDEALGLDVAARGVEPLAFRIHPGRELARKLRQRCLGARDRVVAARCRHFRHRHAQRIGRRDHLVVAVGGDRRLSRLCPWPLAIPAVSAGDLGLVHERGLAGSRPPCRPCDARVRHSWD